MNQPMISVVMSVYNTEKYLREAIESILNQTYTDFEFIIINDGSKDKSLDIIKSFDDPRIRLVTRENKGLTYSLNEGIGLARGKYIARQDADDLSLPERFAREIKAMEGDPKLGLIGSNYTIIDEAGQTIVTTKIFTHPDDLKIAQLISNQYGHGSIMMRKSILDEVGTYDSSVGIVEDYDLFVRISKVAKIANIPEPLYLWRSNPEGVSLSNADEQIALAFKLRDRQFEYFLDHRKEFRIFTSWHPFSFYPNPLAYFDKKSLLLRDLAYLYWKNKGDRLRASAMQILATLLGPWRKRNFRYALMLLRNEKNFDKWQFEFL